MNRTSLILHGIDPKGHEEYSKDDPNPSEEYKRAHKSEKAGHEHHDRKGYVGSERLLLAVINCRSLVEDDEANIDETQDNGSVSEVSNQSIFFRYDSSGREMRRLIHSISFFFLDFWEGNEKREKRGTKNRVK